MTSSLSWEQILKSSGKVFSRIFLPIILFLFIGLFWFFRPFGFGFLNGFFALALLFGCLYFYIKKRAGSLEPLVFLSVLLGFFALYNLQFAFFIPLWLSLLLVFLFTFGLFIYLAYELGYFQNSFLYSFGLSVCLIQVFYALSLWPTNPLSKSFILTSLFYAFWFIVVKKEKVVSYLVLVAFVLILVIATTRWSVI